MFRRLIQIIGMLVFIPVLAIGCSNKFSRQNSARAIIPVQKDVPQELMLALLPGTLVWIKTVI